MITRLEVYDCADGIDKLEYERNRDSEIWVSCVGNVCFCDAGNSQFAHSSCFGFIFLFRIELFQGAYLVYAYKKPGYLLGFQ